MTKKEYKEFLILKRMMAYNMQLNMETRVYVDAVLRSLLPTGKKEEVLYNIERKNKINWENIEKVLKEWENYEV